MGPRVMRIIARLNIGGPARHVVLLNEGLERQGYDTLLVHGQVREGEASLEHLVVEGGLATVKVSTLGRRIDPLDDACSFWKLLRLVFHEKPDVVHTHTAKAGALGRVAALVFNLTRRRERRCVVVHTFHGHVLTGYFPEPVNMFVRQVERWLAVVTDRIITISSAQQKDIVDTFNIAPASRTTMVPLGLSLAPLLNLLNPLNPLNSSSLLSSTTISLRRELGIGERDFVVGYVGRLVPIKDLPTLVRGFAIAAREVPNSWLLIAGDGPERPALEALSAELGTRPRVRFIGWTEALPALYATMDVCALTSLNEGTPVAIIEAMAAARAVVATAVGGVPDVVRDGETGLLIPHGEPSALAAAVIRLSNAELRQRLGARAREDVGQRFAGERLVADVAALYADLLRQRTEEAVRRPATETPPARSG